MRSPKILVVEDDEPVASMLCFLLEEEGYGCIQTGNAEDGWNEVLAQSFSAAVVDLRLPGRDGWWLLRKIRNEQRTHRLPTVLITGFLDDDVIVRAAELGCECLGKPFSLTDLNAKLGSAASLAARLRDWTPPRP
ncbi:MAG TPA: response regulator [Actinomycetota bacterium]|nr:response regulator [Actinomycetota bacterium]